jgi:SHS2 domain-containing protein
MDRGFEILEHTADTGFRAFAPSLEALFEQAAAALVAIAVDPARARGLECVELAVRGSDLEELMINWLNEILWLLDGRRFVPAVTSVLELHDGGLRAAAAGEPRDDSRHPPRVVVKAATFHQLRLGSSGGGWMAEVFLDI